MLFKFPKDDKYFSWTQHVKNKMLQYRLSEQKIKAVLKNYNRKEEGIAPKTLAVMKRNDTPKRKQEIWVMFQEIGKSEKRPTHQSESRCGAQQVKRTRVISAWRYPGISPKGKEIPIPEDILNELEKLVNE